MKKLYVLAILLFIFLFSFFIRNINNVPDRILSFDPVFMYRSTWYVANYGHMPIWDELSYYPGKIVNYWYSAPLMFYLTSMLYSFLKGFGMSLLTVASYAGALYGAMMVIPAFLLGRELSNEKAGLLSAVMVGTAPQVLGRTFGASYDSDQIVLFFILLTVWAVIYALKRKSVPSFCIALGSLAAFMLAYSLFSYTFVVMMIFLTVYLIVTAVRTKLKFCDGFFKEFRAHVIIMAGLFIGLYLTSLVSGADFISSFTALNVYANQMETWIVNISIAELQTITTPQDVMNFILYATGRFVTGVEVIDFLSIASFLLLIIYGLYRSFRTDRLTFAFLLSLILISYVMLNKGARFAEFTTILMAVAVSAGFGCLMDLKSEYLKIFMVGAGVLLFLFMVSLGMFVGQQLGPDVNANWDGLWNYLKTETPELSLVGTWWDPGHMIAGTAERRNFADGAHCTWVCKYTINDRITDLGRIMATTDESESIGLISKYRGNSPEVYWIASNDLIYKYQWLEYFGMGCNPQTDRENCPIYMVFSKRTEYGDTQTGNVVIRAYESSFYGYFGLNVPLFFVKDGINGYLVRNVISDYNGVVTVTSFQDESVTDAVGYLKPLEKEFNFRFSSDVIEYTVWIDQDANSIAVIHPALTRTIFYRMYFLEGKGLECFDLVYRNNEVRLYKIKNECLEEVKV